MTYHRNFPLRAALGGAARGNGTTIQKDSHLAALNKPAAASRRAMLVPVAGSVGSAIILTEGLRV